MDNLKELIEKHKDKSILYVEDEDFVREQMEKVLCRLFKDVTTACDGQDALNKYGTRRFDIILTDIQMPNMDGVDMTKRILAIEPMQPVVVMTAFNQNSELLGLLDMGVKKIITKPVSLSELFGTFISIFE